MGGAGLEGIEMLETRRLHGRRLYWCRLRIDHVGSKRRADDRAMRSLALRRFDQFLDRRCDIMRVGRIRHGECRHKVLKHRGRNFPDGPVFGDPRQIAWLLHAGDNS